MILGEGYPQRGHSLHSGSTRSRSHPRPRDFQFDREPKSGLAMGKEYPDALLAAAANLRRGWLRNWKVARQLVDVFALCWQPVELLEQIHCDTRDRKFCWLAWDHGIPATFENLLTTGARELQIDATAINNRCLIGHKTMYLAQSSKELMHSLRCKP